MSRRRSRLFGARTGRTILERRESWAVWELNEPALKLAPARLFCFLRERKMPSLDASIEAQAPQVNRAHIRI